MYRPSSIVRGFIVLFTMGVVTAVAASASATPPLKLPIQCHDTLRVSNAHNMSTHTGQSSWAWDFSAPRGTPVVAPADGVISHVYQSATAECTSATGNYVVIDFGDGTSGLYAHLAPYSAYVSVGDQVQTGDLIAEVGTTGNSCGPHLHFAIQQTCGSWLCQSIQADFDFHGDPADNTYVTSHNCPASQYTPKHATSSCQVSAGEGVIIEEDGSCASQSGSWYDMSYDSGSGGHWYAAITESSAQASKVATWTFQAGVAGDYELFAYVPPSFTESTQATYVISDSTTTHGTVQVNQAATEYLVSLGTFTFGAGTTVTIELGNNTGETSWARVAADAMYVIHQGSSSSTPQPAPAPEPDDSTTDDSTTDDSTTDDSTTDDSTTDDSTTDDSTTDDSTTDDSTTDDSTTDDSTTDDSTSDDSGSDDSASDDSTAEQPSLSVTGFTPDTVSISSSKDVQIDGTGFQPGAQISFSGGSGPPPRAVNVVVFDSTTIGATLLVKRGGPKRPRRWDVHVTNPDGSSVTLRDALLIAP